MGSDAITDSLHCTEKKETLYIFYTAVKLILKTPKYIHRYRKQTYGYQRGNVRER